jgi:hypothetical protein
VRLIDERTGEPIPEEGSICWCARAEDVGEDLLRCGHAEDYGGGEPPTEPGVYVFRAPRGVLSAWYWGGDVENPSRHGQVEVELKPGLNRVVIKAEWISCVDIVFTDGAMPIPVDPAFAERVEVAALAGEGEMMESAYDRRGALRVHVKKLGRYRISFPTVIEGYEPIQPVEIDFTAGKTPRIEVALKRR